MRQRGAIGWISALALCWISAVALSLVLVGPPSAVSAETGASIETIAGYGSGHGDGLHFPRGLAVGPDDSVYVADTYHHRIQRVQPNGTVSTVAGGGKGSGANQLRYPYGVAVADDGTVYVADTGNNRVQRVSPSGTTTTVRRGLSIPSGIAIDDDGSIYVADTGNHRIVRIITSGTETGALSVVAGGNGKGDAASQLHFPRDVIVAHDGTLLIADTSNDRVQHLSHLGVASTVPTGPLYAPLRLALDGDDGLYIADMGNHRIQVVSELGSVDTIGGQFGNSRDELSYPHGVGFDSTGALLVLDSGNYRVQRYVEPERFFAGAEPVPPTGPETGSDSEQQTPEAGYSGLEGSVARLYLTVLDREPDAPGLRFWVGRAEEGMSLRDMAAFFITSREFTTTYDDVNDAQFVDLLYQNVMGRAGDPGGVAYWNSVLADGVARSFVVLQFSESPEFKTLTGTS